VCGTLYAITVQQNRTNTMQQTITVAIKNVYGTEYVYPVCATAVKLAQLTGRKTFTRHDINTIKALGYAIKVATPVLEQVEV
jgi:histone H3/H4